MIDPKEVMQKYSVAELCETAERYYSVVSDPTPLMSKPFSFLHETPEMLQNLGLLLSGLQLGKTMTVLDFGAGSCWLSRYLSQLNCQPICCDASKTALEIGRRLVAEHPLIGTVVYTPRFLWFDGHTIELPDESVDRIVCFDTFHHIPNPGEVVRELARVLKQGGIAGFSEPGRRHSQTPQSQYEMRNHKVLENDIDLNAISGYGTAAGFTELTVKALVDLEMPLRDYNALYGAGDAHQIRSEIANQTYNTMFNRTIFFLHKGPLMRDSRSHVGLAHTMQLDRREYSAERGAPLRVSLTLTNSGEATWLHANSEIFGVVRIGTHLYDAADNLIAVDHSRHDLPLSVGPGQTIRTAIDVPLPEPGLYRVAFDLVAEGVTWFENVGSKPVIVTGRMT